MNSHQFQHSDNFNKHPNCSSISTINNFHQTHVSVSIMLDDRGDLAIAILAFYAIGLPVAAYVCFRHGFGRQLGWFYLLLLPVVRIAGAGIEITAQNLHSPRTGLYTGAAVLYSIGLVPLLLCLMGLLKRM